VNYKIDLSNNIDAYGNIDEKDNVAGYAGDWHYFKAGAYNQCSTKNASGMWYAACAGTGDWAVDKANGDYASVTFSALTLSQANKQ
jgi:poly(beta-D-mannuronate) lyase